MLTVIFTRCAMSESEPLWAAGIRIDGICVLQEESVGTLRARGIQTDKKNILVLRIDRRTSFEDIARSSGMHVCLVNGPRFLGQLCAGHKQPASDSHNLCEPNMPEAPQLCEAQATRRE